MPSIVPSYVYTLFASIIVGTLIITMCGLAVASIKSDAEEQKLSSIVEYVAAEGIKLAAHAPADNLTVTVSLDVPALIGNQRYWLQIQSDSAETWVEAGFGAVIISSEQRAQIPAVSTASGFYLSGSGAVYLTGYSDTEGFHLTLHGGN